MAGFIRVVVSALGLLLFAPFTSAACCNYGCCDCGCIASKPAETMKKSANVAGQMNRVLARAKVSGYVSEFRIAHVKPSTDGKKKPASFLPKSCTYVCTEDGDSLLCKAQCE